MQFPLLAGGVLCGLYALIKFFGKEVVNPLLLTYMGIGSATGIKAGLKAVSGKSLDSLDEKPVISLHVKQIYLELDLTLLDILSLCLSGVAVAVYIISKNWVYNNLLAINTCVHGI